jgi:hypothetical protein
MDFGGGWAKIARFNGIRFRSGMLKSKESDLPMNQTLFFLPTEDWHRKIRRRLELLEGERLTTREAVLGAFLRNRDSFQPDAWRRIEMGLRIYDQPPDGACLTCGTPLPDLSRYFCSTLCEQSSGLVIRKAPERATLVPARNRPRPRRAGPTLPRRGG